MFVIFNIAGATKHVIIFIRACIEIFGVLYKLIVVRTCTKAPTSLRVWCVSAIRFLSQRYGRLCHNLHNFTKLKNGKAINCIIIRCTSI